MIGGSPSWARVAASNRAPFVGECSRRRDCEIRNDSRTRGRWISPPRTRRPDDCRGSRRILADSATGRARTDRSLCDCARTPSRDSNPLATPIGRLPAAHQHGGRASALTLHSRHAIIKDTSDLTTQAHPARFTKDETRNYCNRCKSPSHTLTRDLATRETVFFLSVLRVESTYRRSLDSKILPRRNIICKLLEA